MLIPLPAVWLSQTTRMNMTWIIIETFVSQVKDPDVTGKMVHDTWNEMSGGIKVRIKKFENLFCICM